MSGEVTISRAEHRDYPGLACLWRDCFGDSDRYISSFYEGIGFFGGGARVITARADGGIIGMANLIPAYLKSSGFAGTASLSGGGFSLRGLTAGYYIFAVCVAPAWRGQGLFRAVMGAAEDEIRAAGGAFALLIPADGDLSRTYARLGYTGRTRGAVTFSGSRGDLFELLGREFGCAADAYLGGRARFYPRYLAGCAENGCCFVKSRPFFEFSLNEYQDIAVYLLRTRYGEGYAVLSAGDFFAQKENFVKPSCKIFEINLPGAANNDIIEVIGNCAANPGIGAGLWKTFDQKLQDSIIPDCVLFGET